MARRRKGEKARRKPSRAIDLPEGGDLRLAERVERLAYTRVQAAEALGVSLATLDRRVVPAIASVLTEWGGRLIPVFELERYLAECTEVARAERKGPARVGRRSGLSAELLARVREEHASGRSLAEIARRLNADGVPTSQGGRQWWPSTVRAVLGAQVRLPAPRQGSLTSDDQG